ncbi:kinesin motor protein [Ordospora pajunii]|uniref:kinesin motor protein n=1 Tax=Ordospora pajunii TaxID=3039483 RepID=UPI0029526FA4|nr:kinesin motor protein [Ordospora pajunii]KAH9411026.1 kinesin motor protein [Ordospora pajunii]
MAENVRTYLRIKPQAIPDGITATRDTIKIDGSEFCFDRIFRNSTQQEVFQEISKSLLVECMQGYNCTLFAYGQTGSGKTYTIQGNDHNMGIVQRSLDFLHRHTGLKVSLSFVEIYNEMMLDLLDPNATLSIREDPCAGVVVDNLTVVESSSYDESMELYMRGLKIRKISSTAMNKESSRSHCVLMVYLCNECDIVHRASRLCFVDLAGSERLREREIEELRMKEAMNINKSLLCLGKVINKLSGDADGHIGYRESKLTFLLKDSLGGNCKLTVIGNVSLENRSDSVGTMNFLRRSRMIKNPATVNSDVNGELEDVKSKLKELDVENQSLKAQIALMDIRPCSMPAGMLNLQYEVNEMSKVVDDAIRDLVCLEREVGKISQHDFDVNRKLLLDIHEYFVSMSDSRRRQAGLMMKRKGADED